MCQSSAGNKINTDLTDLLDIFFCDVTGAFCLRSSVNQFDCLFHNLRCHIIQHDNVCTCFNCFFYLIKCLYFYLNLAYKWGICFCHLDCFCNTARSSDMVVFQQDTIRRLYLWLCPPPTLTAYFSNTRQFGVVFLVSRSVTLLPSRSFATCLV